MQASDIDVSVDYKSESNKDLFIFFQYFKYVYKNDIIFYKHHMEYM